MLARRRSLTRSAALAATALAGDDHVAIDTARWRFKDERYDLDPAPATSRQCVPNALDCLPRHLAPWRQSSERSIRDVLAVLVAHPRNLQRRTILL